MCRSSKRFSGLADKAKNFCRRSYSHPDRSGEGLVQTDTFVNRAVFSCSFPLPYFTPLASPLSLFVFSSTTPPLSTDPMAVCLAAAFLLNTHNYQHLISFDHPFTPGKVTITRVCVHVCSTLLQVAPRLAIAALAMKEDRDARKSIRDVFSAGTYVVPIYTRAYSIHLNCGYLFPSYCSVLSVFSTPVSSEMRSEVGHKQLQLRYCFMPHSTTCPTLYTGLTITLLQCITKYGST